MSSPKGSKIVPTNQLFEILNKNTEEKQLNGAVIIEEVRRNPNSAAIKYDFPPPKTLTSESTGRPPRGDCYPLHQAIYLRASIDIVKAIYDSYPPALKEKCDGETVLHLACRRNVPAEVISFVLNKFPEAVIEKDDEGSVPLHYACRWGASVNVVSSLLENGPYAAMVKNIHDDVPLHVASEHASIEIVSLLLEYCPRAIRQRGHKGFTPLHCACSRDASMKKILLLLETWPEAMMERDNDELTPDGLYDKAYETRHTPRNDSDQRNSENIQKLFSYVHKLCSGCMDNGVCNEMVNYFVEIEWWNGVYLILETDGIRNQRLSKFSVGGGAVLQA